MITEELVNTIKKIYDVQELANIAHYAMARACILECTLGIESECEFHGEGSLFLRTKIDFDIEPEEEEGGEP